MFAKFRAAFDLLERDTIVGQSFAAELTPEEAVAAFAEAYGAHLAALTPGNPYAVTEYHVLQSGIVSQTLDGSVVWGGFVCAAAPADADEQAVWSGEAIRTEYTFYAEQYGGMLLAQKSVILERQEDGAWRCLAVGEGQARFPQKMEWTDGGFTFDS
ncbi:MAG: hypothetical protein IJL69_04110 [Oscillospiraceae bacterium]|nr:hypothetical protein [Oscillospiraceae bacterium]